MQLGNEDYHVKYDLVLIDKNVAPEVYHIQKHGEHNAGLLCGLRVDTINLITDETTFTEIFADVEYSEKRARKANFVICEKCLEALKEHHSDYDGQYKCRLCGEVYASCGTSNKRIVTESLMQTLHGIKATFNIGIVPSMFEQHFCKDGSQGVADFIGFKRKFVPRVS